MLDSSGRTGRNDCSCRDISLTRASPTATACRHAPVRYASPMRVSLAVLGTLLVAGCTALTTTSQSKVIQQASFDHDCPRERIAILEENRSIWAYRLDVCGTQRKYRDV